MLGVRRHANPAFARGDQLVGEERKTSDITVASHWRAPQTRPLRLRTVLDDRKVQRTSDGYCLREHGSSVQVHGNNGLGSVGHSTLQRTGTKAETFGIDVG